MKANIVFRGNTPLLDVEVSSITEYIFSVKVPVTFDPTEIKELAEEGVSVSFYSSFISLIFGRKDITSYELF